MPRLSHRPDRLRHLRRPRPGHHTLWMLLSLLLLGGGTAQGADLPSRYRALVIAIDRYEDPSWAPLQAAVFDGEAIGARLQAQFGFEEVTTLFNEEATRAGMQDALDRFLYEAGPHDNLFLVFSGHGYHDNKDGFWVPHDGLKPTGAPTEGWLDNQLLSLDQLKRRVHLTPAKHLLIVADSCFSGALATLRGERRGPEGALPTWWEEGWYEDLEGGKSIEVITSGGIEPVLDRVRLGDEALFDGHSPFAWALLDALEGMEMPRRSAAELFADVGKRAAYAFRELGFVEYQQPRFGALDPQETQRVGSFVWRNATPDRQEGDLSTIRIRSDIPGDIYVNGNALSRGAQSTGEMRIFALPGTYTFTIESRCLRDAESVVVVVETGPSTLEKSVGFNKPSGELTCTGMDAEYQMALEEVIQQRLEEKRLDEERRRLKEDAQKAEEARLSAERERQHLNAYIKGEYEPRRMLIATLPNNTWDPLTADDFSVKIGNQTWWVVLGDGTRVTPNEFMEALSIPRPDKARPRSTFKIVGLLSLSVMTPVVSFALCGQEATDIACLTGGGLSVLTAGAIYATGASIQQRRIYGGALTLVEAGYLIRKYNRTLMEAAKASYYAPRQSSLPPARPKKVAFSLTPAGLSMTF